MKLFLIKTNTILQEFLSLKTNTRGVIDMAVDAIGRNLYLTTCNVKCSLRVVSQSLNARVHMKTLVEEGQPEQLTIDPIAG